MYFIKFVFIFIAAFIFKGSCQECIVTDECICAPIVGFDCHSPSIAEIEPGVLCAVWKGGAGSGRSNIEMKRNVGIWLSRYKEGVWSQPVQIVNAHQLVCWNPVLFQHPSGDLLLFYRMGPNPRNVVARLKRSYDGGQSWTEEENLPAGFYGPTKSKPLLDSEGNIVCGSSIECGEPTDHLNSTACWIEITDVSLSKWKKYGPLEIPGRRFGALEPVLLKDQEGLLTLLCRDRAAKIGLKGWIWMAKSSDNGKMWSELKSTALPNPDSGIEAIDLGNGDMALIYNHSHIKRFPLCIAFSKDGGHTWQRPKVLEKISGEMPSAIFGSDGLIHIVYAWSSNGLSQRGIKHLALNPSLIKNPY